MHMDIEWDADKAVANFKKHGVRFEEAATSLLDPQALRRKMPIRKAKRAGFLLA
jgi:uncharacterized DUF497 family protein